MSDGAAMVRALRMDGPALVFGGPYSNLDATAAVLAMAERWAIPARRIVCTGDVIAYCADPAGTLEMVRRAGIAVVQGNCEQRLGAAASDCGCGFAEGSACEALSRDWFAHASAAVTDGMRAWMAALPRRLDLVMNGLRLAVVHADIETDNRFLFASSPDEAKLGQLRLAGVDGVIAGHCGIPFTQVIDGRLWHNPGAVGMPANDGTPRVWCSVLTPHGEGLRIAHHAIGYDHEAAAAKMRRARLPEGYAATLESGLWPSLDVLPAAERRRTGIPLDPGAVEWAAGRDAPGSAAASRDLWPATDRDAVRATA